MSTITVRNVPEELLLQLRESARRNHRSLNREVIAVLEGALLERDRGGESMLERVRSVRALAPSVGLTDDDLRRARDDGRP